MMSEERIGHLRDIHIGEPTRNYPLTDSDWTCFARAVEAEALAEPLRLMREWSEANTVWLAGISLDDTLEEHEARAIRLEKAQQAIHVYLGRMK